MPDNIFITVLNMSVVSSLAIVFVLALRLLLKKTPKIFSYMLWAVVLVRLLCPFSFESAIGLMPNAEPIPQDIIYEKQPEINTGFEIIDNSVNEILPPVITPGTSVNPIQIWLFIGRSIWTVGIMLMLIYSVISLIRLRQKLIGATPLKDNIYIADHINTPFVIGLIKPKIYLPSNLTETERNFVISHEQTHIKRLDHITRIVAFIALCLHWFNPFVWIAFVLSGKDMETSCDESVMRKMERDIRADYSKALLKFATGKKIIAATPLAFGEGDTKGRVKNVMRYKKPVVWVTVICGVLVGVIAVSLLSNRSNNDFTNVNDNTMNPSMVDINDGTSALSLEAIWKNRTEYVGDNSAVGNIISGLSFPKDIKYENFSLDTDEPPFGLTINLSIDEDISSVADQDISGFSEKTSALLFSIIGNVDNISFDFNSIYSDGFSMSRITFYRSGIEKIYGEDLFSKTETLQDFNLFYNELYNEHNDAPLYDLIPMVMIDGKLYLDTGMKSQTINRDDYLDGEITSAVPVQEKPSEHNQSNFGTGFGYQIIDSSSVEIEINDSWYIFKLEEKAPLELFHDLSEGGEIQLTLFDIGSYTFRTSSEQLSISLESAEQIDASFSLYDANDNQNVIAQFDLTTGETDTFTNLNSTSYYFIKVQAFEHFIRSNTDPYEKNLIISD